MFNFARKRNGDLSKNMVRQKTIFESKPFEQRLKEDGFSLAKIMVGNGLAEPEDALSHMGGVEYWQYVGKYEPDYLEKVLEQTGKIAKKFSSDFFAHPEKYPLPAKQPPGGAPGGATASAKKRIIVALHVEDIVKEEAQDYQ